jgi:hypothetical protein
MKKTKQYMTISGIRVNNYTRYNTDDLMVLLNACEESLNAIDKDIIKPLLPLLAAPTDASLAQINIRDYNPSGLWRDERRFDPKINRYVHARVRKLTDYDSSWGSCEVDIAVVPPGKMYADPLEAMTAMAEDVTTISTEMLTSLWRTMQAAYLLRCSHGSLRAQAEAVDHPTTTVRIEARREGKRSVDSSAATYRAKLVSKLRTSRYYGARSVDAGERVVRSLNIGNKHAKRANLPPVDVEEIERLIGELREHIRQVDKYMQAIG